MGNGETVIAARNGRNCGIRAHQIAASFYLIEISGQYGKSYRLIKKNDSPPVYHRNFVQTARDNCSSLVLIQATYHCPAPYQNGTEILLLRSVLPDAPAALIFLLFELSHHY